MALIVVSMNGIGGTARDLRRNPESHISGVTRAVLDKQGLDTTNIFVRRGGSGLLAKRAVRKYIAEHNFKENTLLCTGKSYGAKNLIRVLWQLFEHNDLQKYRSVGLLTLDIQLFLHNINKMVFDTPPLDYILNFKQTGRMGGGQINPRKARIQGWNKRIVGFKHTEIEECPEVRSWIRFLTDRLSD